MHYNVLMHSPADGIWVVYLVSVLHSKLLQTQQFKMVYIYYLRFQWVSRSVMTELGSLPMSPYPSCKHGINQATLLSRVFFQDYVIIYMADLRTLPL